MAKLRPTAVHINFHINLKTEKNSCNMIQTEEGTPSKKSISSTKIRRTKKKKEKKR